MPFVKGQSGNPGGRPKGRQNNATTEVRALAQGLFDENYWRRVRAQLIAGTLHPSIETKLLAYAFGEPKQDHAGAKVVVNLGFLTPAQSSLAIEDQNTIDATAQVMTLPERRPLT
jgi:hypothetical protein